ncbi:alpha/beta hydrolase [Verticiella sediminum]|uniref:Alpha/beta hydrolase n=1 Tax=Verticiella sediminum TaxID=1247510 RepID=A0A556A979_9BURK|nr:alpha/beta hydrolase [Verticiella sediminum]TSH89443.1 alpha/beta hydrolase [Verticiella sediminum]
MPTITARDGTALHYEEAGSGTPILFVHEFGGDWRSWEPQMRYFTRRYRCITYSARGYPPSDVPTDPERYSQAIAVDDMVDVLDGLGIDRAHIVGLSMGGFATLHFGLRHPDRARSLVVAGAGYGAEKAYEDYFRGVSMEVARQFEELGAPVFAKVYAQAASRIVFQVKDPRGWEAFARELGEHSSIGSALTMRGVQARRPSIYDLEAELRTMTAPTLVVVGDEDDHCLQPGIFMKKTIPASGLLVLPKTGHTLNIEEPALFNQFVSDFLATVEQDKWPPRDPRSLPGEIMKTS